MSEEYPEPTEFPAPKNATKFGARADCVLKEAWFDTMPRAEGPVLFLKAKDGDMVCVPPGKSMEILKKLIRRGRNP